MIRWGFWGSTAYMERLPTPPGGRRPDDRARIDVRCNKDSGGGDDGGTGRAEHCRVIGRSESPKVARGVSIDLCTINHPRLPEEQPVKPPWREAADRDQHLRPVRRHLEAVAAVHVQPGWLRIFGIGARERARILVAEVEIEPSAARGTDRHGRGVVARTPA